MDSDSSSKFIGSLTKFLQSLCNGYVEFEDGVNLKNQNLVREYLARLVGKDSVTIGAVKMPRGINLKEGDFLTGFLKHVDLYIFAIFTGLFMLSLFLLQKSKNSDSKSCGKKQTTQVYLPKSKLP